MGVLREDGAATSSLRHSRFPRTGAPATLRLSPRWPRRSCRARGYASRWMRARVLQTTTLSQGAQPPFPGPGGAMSHAALPTTHILINAHHMSPPPLPCAGRLLARQHCFSSLCCLIPSCQERRIFISCLVESIAELLIEQVSPCDGSRPWARPVRTSSYTSEPTLASTDITCLCQLVPKPVHEPGPVDVHEYDASIRTELCHCQRSNVAQIHRRPLTISIRVLALFLFRASVGRIHAQPPERIKALDRVYEGSYGMGGIFECCHC